MNTGHQEGSRDIKRDHHQTGERLQGSAKKEQREPRCFDAVTGGILWCENKLGEMAHRENITEVKARGAGGSKRVNETRKTKKEKSSGKRMDGEYQSPLGMYPVGLATETCPARSPFMDQRSKNRNNGKGNGGEEEDLECTKAKSQSLQCVRPYGSPNPWSAAG